MRSRDVPLAGSGCVDMTEFLKGIRGTLNANRRVFVDMAFAILDRDKSGCITVLNLSRIYTGSDEDIREMMRALGDKNGDGAITKDEWYDYYSGVSANFDTDDHFELMMRNACEPATSEPHCL